MYEQRHANRSEITIVTITIPVAPKHLPGARQDGMGRRTNRQQVENAVLNVGVPARRQKTRLRFPTVREQVRITVEHPMKIYPVVDCRGEAHDFLIVTKV